jgi:hypothetical protein
MAWVCKTQEEFKKSMVKNHGREILKDMEKARAGEITLRDVAKIYGFHESRAGQIFHKFYSEKKSNHKDNKDYLNRKLEGVDRGKIAGFKKYYSQRPFLFKEIYKADYSDQTAEREFNGMGL